MMQASSPKEAGKSKKPGGLVVILSGIFDWELMNNAKDLVTFLEDCNKMHLLCVGSDSLRGPLPDIDRMEEIAKRLGIDVSQFSSGEERTKVRKIISEKIKQFNQRVEFLEKMVTGQKAAYGARYMFAKEELIDLDKFLAIMPDGSRKGLEVKLNEVKQKCFGFNQNLKDYNVVTVRRCSWEDLM